LSQAGVEADGHARVAPEPLSPLHPTQVFVVVSQNAVDPVQALVFVAVHATHAPARQAGASDVGQGRVPPLPKSPVHCSHPPEPASVTHTGNADTQSVEVVHG
jgi:hypothetical protein